MYEHRLRSILLTRRSTLALLAAALAPRPGLVRADGET
jgi:hypothetical protein